MNTELSLSLNMQLDSMRNPQPISPPFFFSTSKKNPTKPPATKPSKCLLPLPPEKPIKTKTNHPLNKAPRNASTAFISQMGTICMGPVYI